MAGGGTKAVVEFICVVESQSFSPTTDPAERGLGGLLDVEFSFEAAKSVSIMLVSMVLEDTMLAWVVAELNSEAGIEVVGGGERCVRL